MINLCTSQPTTGTSNIVPFKAGVKAGNQYERKNIRLENTVFETEREAQHYRARFLLKCIIKASKAAERKASNNHM